MATQIEGSTSKGGMKNAEAMQEPSNLTAGRSSQIEEDHQIGQANSDPHTKSLTRASNCFKRQTRFFGSLLRHAVKLVDAETVPMSSGDLAQPKLDSPGQSSKA